jgi:dihydroorotase
MYDLILRRGRVIDALYGLDDVADVAIENGIIESVGDLKDAPARKVIDVSGCIVTPGLIDIHTHVYPGASPLGFDVGEHSFSDGVSTVVDAGTAGAYTVRGFKQTTVAQYPGRVFAFINYSTVGITHNSAGELRDLQNIDEEALAKELLGDPATFLGIKLRLSPWVFGGSVDNARAALKRSLDIAGATSSKLMVHVADPILPLGEIFEALRPGDIATHVFHDSRGETIMDSDSVFAIAQGAQRRGVVLDLGCGRGGMSYRVVTEARQRGLSLDTISSDLSGQTTEGPVFGLTVTMSKMLATGMPLRGVIASVTSNAAAAIGRAPQIGTLLAGTVADVTVLAPEEGSFRFENHNPVTGKIDGVDGELKLSPLLAIRSGVVYLASGPAKLSGISA